MPNARESLVFWWIDERGRKGSSTCRTEYSVLAENVKESSQSRAPHIRWTSTIPSIASVTIYTYMPK